MLTVFYGPSCVGRTTLMRILARDNCWRFVPVLTTRLLRFGESEKEFITESKLAALSEAGELLSISRSFGNLYSWRKKDLWDAAESPTFWMLDFKISLRHLLVSFRPLEIVVLPPSEETLRQRIRRAGREEREEAILADYHEHYANLESITDPRAVVVVNPESEAEEIAESIHREVTHFGSAFGHA